MSAQKRLRILNRQIAACQECAPLVDELVRPPPLDRGGRARVMIVGQGPGNAEVKGGRPFAGQAGTRLNQWLVECGAAPDDPRKDVYLTSIVKCVAPAKVLQRMAVRCRPFLDEQLAVVVPEIVVTLGKPAYLALRFTNEPYSEALCIATHSKDHAMLTTLGRHFTLLPWPHPSGLNRWHNDPRNAELLRESFEVLRTAVGRTK